MKKEKHKFKIIVEKVLSTPPRWYVGLYSAANHKQLLHSEPDGYTRRRSADNIAIMLKQIEDSPVEFHERKTVKHLKANVDKCEVKKNVAGRIY